MFTDFVATFDLVHRSALWMLLHKDGVPEYLVCLVQDLHHSTFSCVRVNCHITYCFSVESGIFKRCILSQILFNVLTDYLIRQLTEAKVGGAKFKASSLEDLKHVNYIALFGDY